MLTDVGFVVGRPAFAGRRRGAGGPAGPRGGADPVAHQVEEGRRGEAPRRGAGRRREQELSTAARTTPRVWRSHFGAARQQGGGRAPILPWWWWCCCLLPGAASCMQACCVGGGCLSPNNTSSPRAAYGRKGSRPAALDAPPCGGRGRAPRPARRRTQRGETPANPNCQPEHIAPDSLRTPRHRRA